MSAHKQHKQKQEDADAADGLCFIAAQVFCILMMCLAGMLFGGIIGEMQARVPLWLARFMLLRHITANLMVMTGHEQRRRSCNFKL
jgi:hypothetical protein